MGKIFKHMLHQSRCMNANKKRYRNFKQCIGEGTYKMYSLRVGWNVKWYNHLVKQFGSY